MRKIALFGGSFNPPGDHHCAIVRLLVNHFDTVLIVPCGPRSDKESTQQVTPQHRGEMAKLAFAPLIKEFSPRIELDLFDLSNPLFTRTYLLEERYRTRGEVWHVVGTDLIQGGARGGSAIQAEWARGKELWSDSHFAVITRPESECAPTDLPPHSVLLHLQESQSSSVLRKQIGERRDFSGIPLPVAQYISKEKLYVAG